MMVTDYSSSFFGAVIEKSVSENWDVARHEWSVVACVEDPDLVESCICGKEHLRYLYKLRNEKNGNALYPVGSSCIKKFSVCAMEDDADCWKQAFKLMHAAEKLGRGKYVEFGSDLFSRKLISFMHRHGAFQPNSANGWDGTRDLKLLMQAFNARSLGNHQKAEVNRVISTSVYPWLRGVWRATHECSRGYGEAT